MADLDARCFCRKGNSLVPADFAAEEMLAAVKDGGEVMVTVRRARSPQHHRQFFALLRKVCENSEDFSSEDELLSALKLATGHAERQMTIDGKVYLAPRSINFASMDQEEFKRFYNRVKYILADKLGIDAEELMREVDAAQKRAA